MGNAHSMYNTHFMYNAYSMHKQHLFSENLLSFGINSSFLPAKIEELIIYRIDGQKYVHIQRIASLYKSIRQTYKSIHHTFIKIVY